MPWTERESMDEDRAKVGADLRGVLAHSMHRSTSHGRRRRLMMMMFRLSCDAGAGKDDSAVLVF
jgi:hypothetical protein